MESAGAATRINVSEAIYHRTRALFDFEPRGSVEVKSKGSLAMFYLTGIKRELAADEARCQPNATFAAECARLFPSPPSAQ
jgi:adenylate/guanylate cyclase family protein